MSDKIKHRQNRLPKHHGREGKKIVPLRAGGDKRIVPLRTRDEEERQKYDEFWSDSCWTDTTEDMG